MDTSTRRMLRRARMFAIALAATGLTAPLAAQQPAWNPTPSQPVSSSQEPPLANPGVTMPPTGGPVDGPILTPEDGLPQRPESIKPVLPNSPEKFWMASPTAHVPAGPAPLANVPGLERNPRDLGNGWKAAPSPRTIGAAPTPSAAALIMPAGGVLAPRPDWGWHGYGDYNSHSRGMTGTQPVSATSLAAEMAPYMKYAHLWHPTHNGFHGANLVSAPAELPNTRRDTIAEPPTTIPVQWHGLDGGSSADPPITDTVRPADFKNPPTAAPEPPPGPNGRLPLQVRERISQVCAGKARNLAVEQQSPIRLRIAMTVATHADAEWLTSQLASLPELRPYKVDFEVQISQ